VKRENRPGEGAAPRSTARTDTDHNSGQRQAATDAGCIDVLAQQPPEVSMAVDTSNGHFLRVEGPGRCSTCCWHVQTQGHHPQCPGGVETPDTPKWTPTPTDCDRLPWFDDDLVAQCQAMQAQAREAELLAPHQPHMAYAHLLPPVDEFTDVMWYVRVLNKFKKAIAARVRFNMFHPNAEQKRDNAERIMKYEAAQHHTRGGPRAKALGALRSEAEIVATTPIGGRSVLSRVKVGGGNDQLNVSAYTLGAFVNDGDLTETEVTQALMDAAQTWSVPADDDDCRRTIKSGLSSAAGNGITRR
jgi:hypothetical protein